jgi:hypothetical protein
MDEVCDAMPCRPGEGQHYDEETAKEHEQELDELIAEESTSRSTCHLSSDILGAWPNTIRNSRPPSIS